MTESRGVVVIHYAELGTKGKNRSFFVGVLRRNLRRALVGLPIAGIQSRHARIFLELAAPLDEDLRRELRTRLGAVMGIATFSFANRIPGRPLDRLEREACELVERALGEQARESGVGDAGADEAEADEAAADGRWAGRAPSPGRRIWTFAVDTRRGDKSFPIPSPEINRRLGAAIQERTKLDVDIRNPDLNVGVEVLPDSILLYGDREEGQRGLPVGASARVVSLLSSGIDSPVASYRILARGCRVIYVHFHSMPYTKRASVDLTLDLVRQLAPYQPKSELYLVPLAEIQRKIAVEAQSSIRVVLYRRWMVRLAEKVAAKVGARALVTGDSIGQVASQTVENLSVIEEAATIPILRPLVATGKEEIIRMARRIGTYDISTQPYEDCCAFLMPQNPETHVRPDDVRRAEEALGSMEDLVWDALARAERHVIPCVPAHTTL